MPKVFRVVCLHCLPIAYCSVAVEYSLRKLPDEKKYKDLLKEDYDWLLAALGKKEGWRYTKDSPDWDNSATQYGVLGIWAAARAGYDPGDKFWIIDHHSTPRSLVGCVHFLRGAPTKRCDSRKTATKRILSAFSTSFYHEL